MWFPNTSRQKLANYTIEDVLQMPRESARVELLDGVLVVVPTPTIHHQQVCCLLWDWLRNRAPAHLRVCAGIGVATGLRDSFEPDVLVFDRHAVGSKHFLEPRQITLVVEVVSEGTSNRDRVLKPAAYAKVGIPYFWRIEQRPLRVLAFRLSEYGMYDLLAESTELLELSEPFEIKLPIAEITP